MVLNLRLQKGRNLEKTLSYEFHQEGIPLLITPIILRRRNAGQVDLARVMRKGHTKWVQIQEVKAGDGISFSQRNRLKIAAQFIGIVLKLPVELKYSFRTTRVGTLSANRLKSLAKNGSLL
ncbi:MAG: hypothetical protein ACOYL6_14110 [Bacteriovoracaceae bacterium]